MEFYQDPILLVGLLTSGIVGFGIFTTYTMWRVEKNRFLGKIMLQTFTS